MPKFKMKKIDAFTGAKSSGNPAAVIYLEENKKISEEEMQRIAREMKGFVCEAAFVFKQEAGLKIRYFSAEKEVQFCGHATIALMYDYFLSHKEEHTLEIETNKGRLTVENQIDANNAVFISAPEPVFTEHNIGAAEMAEALDLKPEYINNVYPITIVNAGNQTLCVPINKLQNVTELTPEFNKLKAFCSKHHLDVITVFTDDTADKSNTYRTRVFTAPFGYLEDPATGSGNAALGYFLKAYNFWNGGLITLEQGTDLENPNLIKMMIKQDDKGRAKLFFGGQATLRIEGEYFI